MNVLWPSLCGTRAEAPLEREHDPPLQLNPHPGIQAKLDGLKRALHEAGFDAPWHVDDAAVKEDTKYLAPELRGYDHKQLVDLIAHHAGPHRKRDTFADAFLPLPNGAFLGIEDREILPPASQYSTQMRLDHIRQQLHPGLKVTHMPMEYTVVPLATGL